MIIIPIIKIIIGFFIFQIIKKIVKKMSFSKTNLKASQKQKIETLKQMLINISRYIILILVGISLLSDFGINVKSILAGLGIGTAILGLAFNDLAKDLIAGVTIIAEGEYEIPHTLPLRPSRRG